MPDITFISALVGGFLTFLAPCTLPLVPAYLAFIGSSDSGEQKIGISRYRLLVRAVFFVLGFSSVFVLFGLASGTFGKFLILHRLFISQVGGVIVCLFGLSMLGILPQMKGFTHRFPSFVFTGSLRGGFVLGALFGLGWSPCLGPILGTILVLAGSSGTAVGGALLLATYSFGLAIPFLLVALLYGSAFTYIEKLNKYLPLISRVGAVLIIGIGVLLIFGQFGILNSFASRAVSPLGFDRLVDYM